MKAWIPWGIAVGFAAVIVWLGLGLLGSREEAILLRTELRLAQIARDSMENRLQAERLILDRQLADTTRRVNELEQRSVRLVDFAELHIVPLAAAVNSPADAAAVAVWDPVRQMGMLAVSNLPSPVTGQRYRLWIEDPAYPDPVDGGAFTIEDGSGAAHIAIRPTQPVSSPRKFSVHVERRESVAPAEGRLVLQSR